MATTDWPNNLVPQAAQLSLRKAGVQHVSPFNGTLQAVDFVAERWALSASLAPQVLRNARQVSAFCNNLSGGIERVRVWPFDTGGVPQGTMRGAPQVRLAAARGDTVLNLKNALSGGNLITHGGQELDADLNLLTDTWLAYSLGSISAYSVGSSIPGYESARAQFIQATGLGTTVFDQFGMRKVTSYGITPGRTYTLSADMAHYQCEAVVQILWLDSGLGFISATTMPYLTPAGQWVRRSATSTAPAGAAFAELWLIGRGIAGGPYTATLYIDNVLFEQAATASPWPGLPTLLQGDYIAAGGQLFQVAATTTFEDSGQAAVPLVNRVRATIAVDSPVTWYRPTCDMVMPAMQAGAVSRPGFAEGAAIDLVEVW
jgi:hypothetical protein